MKYSQLQMPDALRRAVARMGFDEMTQVQQQAIPAMLAGKDLIVKAPTGTGKTCAFGIPLLMSVCAERRQPQALVLVPTRELAQQVAAELRQLAYFHAQLRVACLYGGAEMRRQTERLKKGAQLIVATPGRLLDHITRGSLDVGGIVDVVLDEADEMLSMGFYKHVLKILEQLAARRRLAMFSATISREVMDIGWLYQRDAEEITVQAQQDSAPQITQFMLLTTGRNKLPDITAILTQGAFRSTMIFCNTKYGAQVVAGQLAQLGYCVQCLHGDLPQKTRNRIMAEFREGALTVLVATDVAARGIDVAQVDAVINYDVPASNEYYTHRIGRTGRARRVGQSYLLYTQDERVRVRDMLRCTRSTAQELTVDDEGNLTPLQL